MLKETRVRICKELSGKAFSRGDVPAITENDDGYIVSHRSGEKTFLDHSGNVTKWHYGFDPKYYDATTGRDYDDVLVKRLRSLDTRYKRSKGFYNKCSYRK